ncbi:MAG: choice-of-anchor Q domain-containing protein [Cyanobacteriota bacterium]|nr:choice-of-anchor Q domain-containing protein [Cyanobacteriota bacterium]
MTTFTVTSTADSGLGSLREAIALAQAGDTIEFDRSLANSTITLTSGQLEVDKDLTIDGADAPNLTLSGNNTNRVLHLGREKDLILKNLTLADGFSSERGGAIHTEGRNEISIENTQFINNTGGQGGAIGFNSFSNINIKDSTFDGNTSTSTAGFSGGAISIFAFNNTTIQNTEFKNNTGVNGGAVYSLLSGLTVEDSQFIRNDSTPGKSTTNPNGFGGGIFVDGASDKNDPDSGTVLVRNTLFDGNRSAGRGGGVFFFLYDPDIAIIEDSTFINHEVIRHLTSNDNSEGGAIWHTDGELIVRNTTVANNKVLHRGGGLWAFDTADVRIENSTFSGNVADDGAGGGFGGAMRVSSATEIINSTIVNNRAGKQGGALFNINRPVTATNTIFANNTVSDPDNPEQQTNVTVNDGGGNIQFPGVTTTGREIQRIVAGATIADPLLGPLQDNGGVRQTYALLDGSPAIDAGQAVPGLLTDQRGIPRNDGQIDIGAFEVEEIPPEPEPTELEPEPTDPTPTDPTPTDPTPTDPTPTNPTPTNPTPTNPTPTDPTPTDPTPIDPNPTDPTPTDPTPIDPNDPTPCLNPGFFPPLRDSFTLCDDFVTLGDEDDLVAAWEGHDLALGNGGDDWIFGNRGNDTLAGGDGNDSLYGGKDNDVLYGNKSDDVLYGDIGVDELYAGQGDDVLFGNTEADILFADLGNDTVYGGRDNDLIFGNLNNDRLHGDIGDDRIYGGRDEDTLDGGDGDDLLSGDAGNDSLYGGLGRDSFVLAEGNGNDTIADFESGEDVLALAEGLTFDRLAISQGTSGAEVRVANTGEVLATLEGVSADTIAAEDFAVL